MKNPCIFCGQAGKVRAKEHVFPLWIQKHLGIKRTPVNVNSRRRTDDLGEMPITAAGQVTYDTSKERSHDLGSLLNGNVCKECNSGWMGELETAARPVLTRMFDEDVDVASLSDRDRLGLARWAAKTAYALADVVGDPLAASYGHPRHLEARRDELPPGVVVFSGVVVPGRLQAPKGTGSYYIGPDWNVNSFGMMPPRVALSLLRRSYKLGFRIDCLELIVAYSADPRLILTPVRGTHRVVFPDPGPFIWVDERFIYAHYDRLRENLTSDHEVLHRTLFMTTP